MNNHSTTKFQPVPPSSNNPDLPERWTEAKLGILASAIKGKKPTELLSEKSEGTVPYIDIKAFETGKFREYAVPASSRMAEKGDILIVWDGARSGLVGKMPARGAVGSTLAILKPHTVVGDYLFLFLQSSYEQINTNVRGTGIPHVDPEILWNLEVPLPPLAEQKRIVAKVEELLARVNAARDRLAKVPAILKRFRKSVLAAACSGRLTEEWRVAHPDVESGSVLIRRIKEARLSAAVSTKERNQIAEAFQPEILEVAEDELAIQAIPEWAPCRIGAIGTVVNGSTPSRKRDDFWDGDIPWVSSGEVRNNIISTTRERISKAGYENSSVRLLPPGTVLVAMIGEGKTRGQSAILQIGATINQNIAAILLSHGLVSSEFLWRWLQFQYELTRERGGGSGPQALNCQSVRELPFLLPPLAEQHEIVRRVDELFSLADAVEKNVAKGMARTEKLTQAILAKAFRGELVPTEAELARREGREYVPANGLVNI